MPAVTTAYVKNIVRRGLRELVDPSPDRNGTARVWDYFHAQCAYCGVALERGKKEGHIDHLVSASKGGPNHISNRVLSCARCNESEKLDMDWIEFLAQKISDPEVRRERREKIEQWQAANPPPSSATDPELLDLASSSADEVTACFDEKVAAIRKQTG